MTTGWTKAISHEKLTAKGSAVVRRGGKQLALFETPEGIFACNNRCPHEGYPLREGTLDGDGILTCNWHNWKFDLKTGANQYGGDGLRVYPVELRGGDVWVDITDPPFEARRAKIMASLREAFDDHDYERIAREIARLRLVGGDPTDAVTEAILWSYQRFEYGWTHAYAGAADWLKLYDERANDPETQLICLLEIVGHIADDTLRQDDYPYVEGVLDYDEDGFVQAMEVEDQDTVIAMLRGGLAAGLGFPNFERGFCRAALAHYAAFGHCIIYVTKAGRLIERLGDRVAAPVLFSLARHTLFSRREDQIPEFRHYATALDSWGKGRNGAAPEAAAFKGLNAKNAMALAARHGGGDPRALYRALLEANAGNMLRYDMSYQRQTHKNIRDNVGWLDFTHAITFANAARQTCDKYPELWPQTLLQMACFSGRNDAYTDDGLDDDQWRVDDADDFFDAGVDGLFDHGRDEYIVSVHYVKTLLAAREEIRSGAAGHATDTVLASLNRLVNSPLTLKHVRRTAHQAMEFVVLDG